MVSLTTIIFSRRVFWSASTSGQGWYFRPPKSDPNRLKISSTFFWWKKELAQFWKVITGWSNCSLGSRMAPGFLWGFAQPIGFIMATFTHLNLFIFYPATTQGLSCTKSEVVNSHLWWCFHWQADVDMFKGSDWCWKGKGGGVRLSGSSGRGWNHDTYHNWEYPDDELETHHFCKQLQNFHHKRFKANCIPASVSPVKADSENGLGFCWARGKVVTK